MPGWQQRPADKPRFFGPEELNCFVRIGGAWPAGVPLGVEANRTSLHRPTLRVNVASFRGILHGRKSRRPAP